MLSDTSATLSRPSSASTVGRDRDITPLQGRAGPLEVRVGPEKVVDRASSVCKIVLGLPRVSASGYPFHLTRYSRLRRRRRVSRTRSTSYSGSPRRISGGGRVGAGRPMAVGSSYGERSETWNTSCISIDGGSLRRKATGLIRSTIGNGPRRRESSLVDGRFETMFLRDSYTRSPA